MKSARSAAGLLGLAMLFLSVDPALAQPPPGAPRPPPPPPVTRALPADETPEPPPAAETEQPEKRQLEYANALFTRKLYDLAIPEYQKYLDDYPGSSGRPNAYFSLGECFRNLNKSSSARTNFQKVLNDYGESEFAGPAAYALAEMAFTQKDYATALPLFHRSATKSKDAAVALSAHYFEARCLEALDHKDEACDIYQQVAEAKNPNPYREDAREKRTRLISVTCRTVAFVSLVGFMVSWVVGTDDSAWIALGWLDFRAPWPSTQLAPGWILGIWLAFSLTLNHSLAFLKQRYALSALLGAIGGPLAYWSASQGLGAVHFDAPMTTVLPGLCVGWTGLFPLLVRMAESRSTGKSIEALQ